MLRTNRNKKRSFPSDYDPDDCILAFIPRAIVPILAGKVAELENRSEWKTADDWKQGYYAIVQWESELMTCGQSLQASLDELLVLLAAQNGIHDPDTPNLQAVFPRLHAALLSAYNADSGHTLLPSVDDHHDDIETLLTSIDTKI